MYFADDLIPQAFPLSFLKILSSFFPDQLAILFPLSFYLLTISTPPSSSTPSSVSTYYLPPHQLIYPSMTHTHNHTIFSATPPINHTHQPHSWYHPPLHPHLLSTTFPLLSASPYYFLIPLLHPDYVSHHILYPILHLVPDLLIYPSSSIFIFTLAIPIPCPP